MLSVFICEDDVFQRKMVQKIIENEIQSKSYQMEVALSTGDPFELLGFLAKTSHVNGLYFLDMDLNNLMNGIELAKKIREVDSNGRIIFVTASGDLADLIHSHKIETMDYIVKDNLVDMVNRMKECLELADHQMGSKEATKSNTLRIKDGEEVHEIPVEDIIFFEYIGSRKIRLHTKDGVLEYEGSLKKMENENMNFFHCHNSFVINVNKIKDIHRKNSEVEMENGEHLPVAIEKLKMLLNRMEIE
jgi:two-component system response regulator AgrA